MAFRKDPAAASALQKEKRNSNFASKSSNRSGRSNSNAANDTKNNRNNRSSSTPTNSSSNVTIKFKTTFRNTIYDVMKQRGWKESDEWDFYWADRDFIFDLFDNMHLVNQQRVNHFRNGRELCRKDLLVKNLKRVKRGFERQGKKDEAMKYDFFPVTYVLPGDYALFVEEFKRNQGVWIMKPIGRAQGKGIFLFTKLNQISEWKNESQQVENYVVQRYISNPYLVGGKKFDLRLYVLVNSFLSLEVYLYRGGFARFTNTRYSNNPSNIANSFMHLTNVAIQKTSDNYNKKHGGKWDLRNLKLYLMSKHGRKRIDKVFYDMQMIIIHSLLSVQKIMISDKHCFELYGYDLMIDDNLKPWLIEVNASPSLSANTAQDYELKFKMLSDMLDVIDLEKKHDDVRNKVGGFDLVYKESFLEADSRCIYSTFLGSDC